MICPPSLLASDSLLDTGAKYNVNTVLVVSANLHRLMADGQSATYILNEEKNEERRREEKQKDGSREGNKKKSVKKSKSFKKIIPPPGVPKQKVNT